MKYSEAVVYCEGREKDVIVLYVHVLFYFCCLFMLVPKIEPRTWHMLNHVLYY